MQPLNNKGRNVKTRKRSATPEEKKRAFELLSDGWSIPQLEKELGINRGTLSRWRRTTEFALFHANRTTGAAAKPVAVVEYQKPVDVQQTKVLESKSSGDLDSTEARGKFLQAVGVGGLAWAQDYSGANDEQVARFIRDLDIRKAHAKPRIMALTSMLKMATSEDVPHAVRVKALTDWWRLADNNLNGGTPMINIDARNTTEEAPKVAEFLADKIREELAEAVNVDLMASVREEIE